MWSPAAPGPERPGGRSAEDLVDAFLDFWRRNDAILRVVDLGAAEGDKRFYKIRMKILNSVTNSLTDAVKELQSKNRVDKDVNPAAVAGAMVMMLAACASHQKGFQTWGVKQAETPASPHDAGPPGHHGQEAREVDPPGPRSAPAPPAAARPDGSRTPLPGARVPRGPCPHGWVPLSRPVGLPRRGRVPHRRPVRPSPRSRARTPTRTAPARTADSGRPFPARPHPHGPFCFRRVPHAAGSYASPPHVTPGTAPPAYFAATWAT